jgi:hypothetical protein
MWSLQKIHLKFHFQKIKLIFAFFCCAFFGELASSDGFACGAVPPFYGQTVLPFF